jgi:hypothetical protein
VDRLDASALFSRSGRRADPPVTRRQFLALTAKAVGGRVRTADGAFSPADLGVPYGRRFSNELPILRGGYGDLLAAIASAVETLDTEVTEWRTRCGERFFGIL